MSTEFIFWIGLAGIFILIAAMWGLFKLFLKKIRRSDSDNVAPPVQKMLLKSVITISKSSDGREIKSTGFEPTLKRSIEPLHRNQKKQNFLELLDELNALDDNQEEFEGNRRKQGKEEIKTASSSGIEASASDETSSQTFIGREAPSQNPGRIELELIIADSPTIKEK